MTSRTSVTPYCTALEDKSSSMTCTDARIQEINQVGQMVRTLRTKQIGAVQDGNVDNEK